MPHGIYQELDRIRDAARTRRAHLSIRALLAALGRLAGALAALAARGRAALDPAGGAHEERA